MRKSPFVLLLNVLLLFALFLLVACGGSPDPTAVPATSDVPDVTEPDPTEPAEVEPEPEEQEEPEETAEPEPEEQEEPEETAEPEEPVGAGTGGEIVIGTSGDVPHQDPLQYQGVAFDNVWRNDMVYERLVELDAETLEPVPNLASAWSVSDDGLVYTFNLRDDVTWHDGEAFTAEDVEFALMRILHPEFPSNRSAYMSISGADAMAAGESEELPGVAIVDDYTIEITLDEPNPAFLTVAAFGLKPLPRHIVEGQPFVDAPYYTDPVGTGPWESVEWVQGDHQTFEANEDYWGGRPNLDRIVYRFIPDPNAILNSFEAGDIHATYLIPPSEIARLQANENLQILDSPPFNIEGIVFNTEHEALSDVRVRQAIAHAFDLELFTGEFLEGVTEPAQGPIIPSSWAFTPIEGLAYDPDRARELLEEAGYGNGLQLTISTNLGNAFRELAATVMQSQLAEVGIQIEIQLQEFGVFFPGLLQGNHEIALIGASGGAGYPDPSLLYDGFHCEGAQNRAQYCNPDLDALLEAGQTTTDQGERAEIYAQAQEILMQEVPEIFAYYRPIPLGLSAAIQGADPAPGRPYHNVEEWSLASE